MADLTFETANGAAERTVVSSRVDGDFTFYRPRLGMPVTFLDHEVGSVVGAYELRRAAQYEEIRQRIDDVGRAEPCARARIAKGLRSFR